MPQPLGLYVHIPFCARKCAYCDFPSWAGRAGDMPAYAVALRQEITSRGTALGRPLADSVFIGGGTPSLLPPAAFADIVNALRAGFDMAKDAEFTVECNPGTVTMPFMETLAASGVNRLSFGMQAAQEGLLRTLGRIHTLADVGDAARMARAVGIDNINLDIMLGLPGQTMADAHDTLCAALALSPRHISCYGLILEDGTPLKARFDAGELSLPDEETERAMYALCRDTLRKHGLEQYEISNFALPGFACRHNVNCWRYLPYLGFGCAAHGFYAGERRENARDISAYIAGEAPRITKIAPDEAMFETMMLGLRLTCGVAEADFAALHGRPLWDVYGDRLAPALADGRLTRLHGRLALTRRGMDVMNTVLLMLL